MFNSVFNETESDAYAPFIIYDYNFSDYRSSVRLVSMTLPLLKIKYKRWENILFQSISISIKIEDYSKLASN